MENSKQESQYLREILIPIAIESWKFTKVVERMISQLNAGKQTQFQSRLRWFEKSLSETMERADIRFVNIEGQKFDPGMAATALNIDEFEVNDELVVDKMLEPIIIGKGNGLLKTGIITLKKMR